MGPSSSGNVASKSARWPPADWPITAIRSEGEKADTDNLIPYYRAANNCLARKVELPRAERYFRKYLSQEPEAEAPNHAAAHWRLGLVLEQEGRKPDAIAELQAAAKMDTNSPAKVDLKRLM